MINIANCIKLLVSNEKHLNILNTKAFILR